MQKRHVSSKLIRSSLKPRPADSSKWDYGHVLVLAGSRGMMGAGILCSCAALRSGAGLVTWGLPESEMSYAMGSIRPEIMTLPLEESKYHSLASSSLPTILEYIQRRKISAVAVGPGLGENSETHDLVAGLLGTCDIPMVVDASALNVLAADREKNGIEILSFKNAKAEVVITPHIGEFSRLTGLTIADIENDRAGIVERFSKENNIVCVLKGSQTIIAGNGTVYASGTGNPGMATGGTGDVLTGIIASLITQVKGQSLIVAAACGAYIHGLAGDIAASSKTEIAMAASDVIESLPEAFKKMHVEN